MRTCGRTSYSPPVPHQRPKKGGRSLHDDPSGASPAGRGNGPQGRAFLPVGVGGVRRSPLPVRNSGILGGRPATGGEACRLWEKDSGPRTTSAHQAPFVGCAPICRHNSDHQRVNPSILPPSALLPILLMTSFRPPCCSIVSQSPSAIALRRVIGESSSRLSLPARVSSDRPSSWSGCSQAETLRNPDVSLTIKGLPCRCVRNFGLNAATPTASHVSLAPVAQPQLRLLSGIYLQNLRPANRIGIHTPCSHGMHKMREYRACFTLSVAQKVRMADRRIDVVVAVHGIDVLRNSRQVLGPRVAETARHDLMPQIRHLACTKGQVVVRVIHRHVGCTVGQASTAPVGFQRFIDNVRCCQKDAAIIARQPPCDGLRAHRVRFMAGVPEGIDSWHHRPILKPALLVCRKPH